MPTIERSILISASPTEVFNLIANIEAIPRFSTSISEVTRISDNNYAWKANVRGISFEWNSAIIEKEEPRYLSWRSFTGLEIRGEYVLEPQDGKTKVTFFIQYRLSSRIIEKALHPIIDKSIDEMYAEILANIKKEIEE